ncbi:class D sortase [Risungbinella massiliensis]|uniref:class D sortase n=1 Tax=Risungbinella massiliensis TaxID=1329796 RepID=UPI0005CC7CF6|nr:class D sortase [Risungbinella massiliensis]
MKWDKMIALCLVIGGTGYASYSLVSYYQQATLVQTIEVPPVSHQTKQQEQTIPTGNSHTSGEQWVIYPQEAHPKKGEHFADLYIPRLKAVLPIIEGTNEEELEKGVGHFSGSVLPGEPDNTVLSGHRDTVFREMGQMQEGDEFHVQTSQGTFIYVIRKMWITDEDDRTVIVSHDKPILTVTTCYPFRYIGPAPQRYIMQAELKQRI